jgi:hypothetical protein
VHAGLVRVASPLQQLGSHLEQRHPLAEIAAQMHGETAAKESSTNNDGVITGSLSQKPSMIWTCQSKYGTRP